LLHTNSCAIEDTASIRMVCRFSNKHFAEDIFKTNTLNSFDDVNAFHPQMINDAKFGFLYKHGVVPSLYVKPTMRFPIERQLRLVFEMPNDVFNPQ
jgi:hypothetical protein